MLCVLCSMIILAIETSCDDTGIALVQVRGKKTPSFSIISNLLSSQVKLHAKYGGVYPSLAKREHQKNLPILLKKTLKKAKEKGEEDKSFSSPSFLPRKNSVIDLIAVTAGPGLEPCLWTGVNFSQDLAKKLKVPIVPVNHIEAHMLANLINGNRISIIFPAVCLVVSGGHTQLILMKNFGKYQILGETRDDAAGECFDKVARILGLDYPGGPVIAATAAKFSIPNSQFSIKLPRPMINQKNYDFSFSGLKTAVFYNFKSQPPKVRKSKEYIKAVAFETQQAIIDVLLQKTIRAIKNYNAKTVILGGGVASNAELRKQLREKIKKEVPNTKYLIPDIKYCTDNAVMTAVAGYYSWQRKKSWKNIKARANLKLN